MKEYIVHAPKTNVIAVEEYTSFYGEPIEELIRCKDCKFFEYDHVEHVYGVPLILAHEICTKWGNGCKTSENGFCFMAERKEE